MLLAVVSEDNQRYTLETNIACQIGLFRKIPGVFDETGRIVATGNDALPLSGVRSTILEKVLEYAEHHKDDAVSFPAPAAATAETRDSDDGDAAATSRPLSNNAAEGEDDDEEEEEDDEEDEEDDDDTDDDDDDDDDDDADDYADDEDVPMGGNATSAAGTARPAATAGTTTAAEPKETQRHSGFFVEWDRKFMEALDIATLIELTKAANYLYMQPLLDLCCFTIANHMKGLTAEQLRQKFNIVNDFTPEEAEEIRRENSWYE